MQLPRSSSRKWCVVLACLVACNHGRGAALIIDWTNSIAAASAAPEAVRQAAALKWFFAHASVGDNICEGLTALNVANSSLYTLVRSSEDAVPPASTQSGRFYDYQRGNPSWQVKFDSFGQYVSNGWAYPKVDIVANKLCWIDEAADVNYGISKLRALELAFPQTIFVYFTIPLDTSEGYQNQLRNDYNTALRSWVRANNRILLDIADIEAHALDGSPVTFSYAGQTLSKLYFGYAADVGHLNDAGKQRVAMAVYSLGIALNTTDRDNDGMPDLWERDHGLNPMSASDASLDPDGDQMSNAAEYQGGTDPADSQSLLKLNTSLANGFLEVGFLAVSNITYAVEYRTGVSTSQWATLVPIAAGAQDRNILLIEAVDQSFGSRLYRVRAQRQ